MFTLITGINGFIGTNLSTFLHKKKIKIIGLGRKNKKYKFKYIRSDLSKLKALPKNIESVIHLAADSPTKNNQKKIFQSNVASCTNLVKLIKKSKIKKIIYCSSFSVYEKNKNKIIKENQKISKKLSYYASSKYECEKIFHKNLKKKNISITIIRLPAILGRNCFKSSFYKIKKKIMTNKKISIYNYNDYFNGIVSVNKLSIFIYNLLKNNKKKFQVVNIGSSSPIKFQNVIFNLAKYMKKNINFQLINKGSSSVIDIKKAIRLGFKPNKTDTTIREFSKY